MRKKNISLVGQNFVNIFIISTGRIIWHSRSWYENYKSYEVVTKSRKPFSEREEKGKRETERERGERDGTNKTKRKEEWSWFVRGLKYSNPVGIYLLKVNNRNTRTRCEIFSKLTIKTKILVSLLLTLNIFHILLWCFYC